MAIISSVRNLFIPRKNRPKIGQPDYGTDMRAIEQWANSIPITELVAGSNITLTPSNGQGSTVEIAASGGGGGGGYASLTGPGETTTPGSLTQAGSFIINGSPSFLSATLTSGVTLTSSNTQVYQCTNGSIDPAISLIAGTSGSSFIKLGTTLSMQVLGNVTINGGAISILASAGITMHGGTGVIAIGASGDTIGFYAKASPPAGRQAIFGSRGGNNALQNLLIALNAIGLIEDDTTA